MLWAVLCHCEDCQRAASADYVSWFGLPKDSVVWEGPRKLYKSSEMATRSFCENCGTPMSYETSQMPDETHLYAPSLDDRALYRPSKHIFWTERVPWVEATSGLPRHAEGGQSAEVSD